MILKLFKLSNIPESPLINSHTCKGETTKVTVVMLGERKAATKFYNWYFYSNHSNLGLIRLPDTKINLSLQIISNILVLYNNNNSQFIIDLHDQFLSLLTIHAQTINYLSDYTIQIEICNFRESMYTRFKNTNLDFLKISKST